MLDKLRFVSSIVSVLESLSDGWIGIIDQHLQILHFNVYAIQLRS